ncbi:MAG: hypothetical protein KAT46_07525 [Deltaproteobacteria bacterium]|nr:hypothetical protein [Deltaproteobacteria bacterium]
MRSDLVQDKGILKNIKSTFYGTLGFGGVGEYDGPYLGESSGRWSRHKKKAMSTTSPTSTSNFVLSLKLLILGIVFMVIFS